MLLLKFTDGKIKLPYG